MHDIKIIRKDPKLFEKKISERNVKFDLKNFIDLDKQNRELIQRHDPQSRARTIAAHLSLESNAPVSSRYLCRDRRLSPGSHRFADADSSPKRY